MDDPVSRSPDFLTWIQDPEHRDEALALYYTAKEFGQRPSYYAFGDKISLMSQYEIDFYVMCVGREHEAEKAREAEQRLKNR